jgi:hypothetical protein
MSNGQRRYFFVHLQKTAGTSLLLRLQSHFGEQAVYPTPKHKTGLRSSFSVDDLQRSFTEDHASLRVVAGHFPLCASRMLGVPFSTFTVLRDPVERTLSYLRQQQQQVPELADMTLEQIYDDPFRRGWLLTNHMVRMLGQTEAELAEGTMAPDDENLRRAKGNLTGELDLFGFQEHFEEFCTDLERRYGWDLGSSVRANTTTVVPAPEDLRERIRRDNAEDVELYRYALDLRDQTSPVP